MKLLVAFYILLKSFEIAKGKLAHFFLKEFYAHEDTLLVWRTRIFLTIFFSTILVGALAYVPNMKISLQSGNWLNALIYTIAYMIVISIVLVRIIPFKIRVWSGLFVFYGIGLTSFLSFGPIGSGRMWLFAFAVLSCLLLGLRAGLFALCLNSCTIFFFAVFQKIKYVDSSSFSYSALEYWLTAGLSFLFLSIVIVVSLGILVDVLEKNLRKEKSLTKELKLFNERLKQEKERVDEQIADIYSQLGEHREALNLYQQARMESSPSFDFDLKFAESLYFNGEFKECIKVLSSRRNERPKDNRLLSLLKRALVSIN